MAGYTHVRLPEADMTTVDHLTVRSIHSTRILPHMSPAPEGQCIPAWAPMGKIGGGQPPGAAQASRADWARNLTRKGTVIPTLTIKPTAGSLTTPTADRGDATMFLPVTPALHTSGRQSALCTNHTGQGPRPKIQNSSRTSPTPISQRQNSQSTLGNTVARPTRTTT